MTNSVQYVSPKKLKNLQAELKILKEEKILAIAKRIDDARQMGDLSENAEYHMAREEMSWAQSRIHELEYILENKEIITEASDCTIMIGSTFSVKINN